MRITQSNKKLFFILLIIIVLVVGTVLLMKAFYQPMKIYHSDFLKISFEYPAKYQVEEKFTNIVLKHNQGQIVISRSGTNFENINEYVNSLSKLNKFTLVDKTAKVINGQDSISGLINSEKHYFIYSSTWTVFSLSAASPELYPDLDQIANSFRYER